MEELWPKIQEWIALYGLKVIAALLAYRRQNCTCITQENTSQIAY
jgi:hypothetical protein